MFGRPSGSEDLLPIEVYDDVRGDGVEHDVGFGGSGDGGAGRGRGVLVGAAVAALALVGAAAFLVGRDDSSTTTPATTVATSAAPPTTAREAAAPRSSAPRRSTTTTVSPLVGLAPVLPTDQPWSIYLVRQDNQRTIRIDVQSGAIEPVSGTQLGFVLSPTERYVVEPAGDGGFYSPSGPMPAGPLPATYWSIGWDDETGVQFVVLVRDDGGAGTELGRIPLAPNEYLLGSTATGEAVVNGPDGRAYVTGLDGRRRRLAEGQVRSVDNGFYVETICDAGGICRHVLHGASELELPYGGFDFWASFSPDGTWVAIASQDNRSGLMTVDLVHLASGEVLPVEDELVAGWSMVSATAVSWTPDGRWAVGAASDHLVAVDVTTGEIRRLPLPTGTRGQASVQAIL